MSKFLATLSLGVAIALPHAAAAVTLVQVDFTGTLTAGSVAVRAPFNAPGSGIVQGMTVGGSFIYDDELTPGPGTGIVLVPFASLMFSPDSAFDFDVGPLNFDLGDATTGPTGITPAIQFNNGVFNGFNYVSDFTYTDALTYRLRFNSRNFQVRRIDPATGFNIGTTVYWQGNLSTALTNERPYVDAPPTVPIPEPATWAMMITGFGLAGAGLRRRRAAAATVSAVAAAQ